jgi:nucleoside-diphosphate-sugar epimerase
MNILVTGGSGNVGRWVVQELQSAHGVTIFDTKEPAGTDAAFVQGSITDFDAIRAAAEGQEAIIHLAAIPAYQPDVPVHQFMDVNVTGTSNVLEAAAAGGVSTVVVASSDSSLGFVFSTHPFRPDYFPLDEAHPQRPQDPYGLSKLLDEQLCQAAHRRYGLQTMALRFCWVWQPDTYAHRARILAEDGEMNVKRHFGYVDVRDVATACRLAAESEGVGYDALFITADDTYADEPTLALIRRHYRGVPQVSDVYLTDPYRSLFDNNRARKVLGWQPQYRWRMVSW